MRDGFIKVAVGTPRIVLADCDRNACAIIDLMNAAETNGAKLLALPELCITGYTCGDLFLHDTLRGAARSALARIAEASGALDLITIVGLPIAVDDRLYNCAAVIKGGRILGVVPKRNPPNYGEFYELRHFAPGDAAVRTIELLGQSVPFGGDLLFVCDAMPDFRFAVEVCEDMWVPDAPGVGHALSGATVIVNPSASDEIVGKAEYRSLLLRGQSARLVCAYLYANAGAGESSTDLVFAGHNLIAENGALLAESGRYETGLTYADLDVAFLASERLRMNTFGANPRTHTRVPFAMQIRETRLDRPIDPMPFVPADDELRARRCEEILDIQTAGLVQRLGHTKANCAVLGISGGLDSTLALIVAARAFEKLNLPVDGLLAVTMPGFGTTGRTYENAKLLAAETGARLIQIPIGEAVTVHFRDIGQSIDAHDVTYENAQARERTQILMDLANQRGGIVIGTGDLSELALGWATYNGDHMSMYAVNASIPKTLVRHLVEYAARRTDNERLRGVLLDILDTPVSPELLPPVDGAIAQKTEDLVGPYELHDFFLYHAIRRMSGREKIARVARIAFAGRYDDDTIDKWLDVFFRRFFSQQFKRSCMPDGPKVGTVALSPRGDLRMPSDACGAIWLK